MRIIIIVRKWKGHEILKELLMLPLTVSVYLRVCNPHLLTASLGSHLRFRRPLKSSSPASSCPSPLLLTKERSNLCLIQEDLAHIANALHFSYTQHCPDTQIIV